MKVQAAKCWTALSSFHLEPRSRISLGALDCGRNTMRNLGNLIFVFRLSFVICLGLSLGARLQAQNSSSGSVLGTVTDRSGAAVAKAEVSLTNAATNATARTFTNDNGQYLFPEVAPGTYKVVAKATGFKTEEIANLKVDVNKSYALNMQVEVGQVSETVEVVAAAQVELQTTDSQVGDVVASRELQRLPTLQRDALNLQGLQPATTPGAGSGLNQDPGNTAGARNDQNTVTLDGFDITDNTTGGQLGSKEVAASTSVEGVEEFRIDVANPTASFGRSPGGVVALVSRSGSNTLHGDAYWYHQENGFNANPWEEGHTALLNNQGDVVSQSTPLLPLHDNREGGAIGGPIQTDKTFFFGRYEKHIFQSNSPVTITIPTPSLRAGILTFPDGNGNVTQYNLATAAVCGAAQNEPCDPRGLGISPSVQKLWSFLPQVGNNTTVGDGLNTTGFTAPVSLPVHDDDASFRLDHNFTKKLHLMGRYAYLKDLQNRSGALSVIGGNFQSEQTLTTIGVFAGGVLDYAISPTMLNTVRFGYIQSHNNISAETPAGAAAFLNVPGSATSQSGLQSLLALGTGTPHLTQTPIDDNVNQARTQIFGNPAKQFGDDFFWTKGKHNLAFGASDFLLPFGIKHNDRLIAVTSPTSTLGVGNGLSISADDRPPTCGGGIATNCIPSALTTNYNNLYGATLGLLNSTAVVAARDVNLNPLPAGSFLIGDYNSSAPQFYAQDTWRVTPSFTLTYGLNYGWQSAPTESNGLVSVLVDPATGVPISSASYFASRQTAAAAGQIFNPSLGWIPERQTKSGKIYNTDFGDVGPRVSAAWNPSFTSGLLGALFGGHKTVLRGGFGIIYDRTNLVSNFLATDLSVGFSQALSSALPLCNGSGTPGPGCNAASTNAALSAFRAGQDGAITLPVAQKLASPIILPSFPNPGFELIAVTNDPNHKEGKNYTADFTVQRDLGHNMIMEVGYIGRFARNLPSDTDLETPDIFFKDPTSGQTFAQAFDATAKAVRTGTGSLDQPWFNDLLFPGAGSFLVNTIGLGPNFANTDPATVFLVIDELKGLGLIPGAQFSNRQTEVANTLRNDFGVSNYNAGFVTMHKRMSHGVQFDLNYTFSKSLGNSPGINQNGVAGIDPFNHGLEYGPSAFNRKHIFNGLYDYELPFGAGHFLGSSHAAVNKIIGGWYTAGIVSIASGLPNFVYSGGGNYGSLNSDSLGLPETAGVTTGVNRGVTGSNGVGTLGNAANCSTDPNGVKFDCGTGINYFANPAAASTSFGPILLSSFAQGHTGLGKVLDGFGYWNVDMRLGKETSLTERIKIEISLDALNVFNNVNFLTPGSETTPGSNLGMDITNPANFGVVGASRILSGHNSSARYLQLGLRFTF